MKLDENHKLGSVVIGDLDVIKQAQLETIDKCIEIVNRPYGSDTAAVLYFKIRLTKQLKELRKEIEK